jgi:hypothetical protein
MNKDRVIFLTIIVSLFLIVGIVVYIVYPWANQKFTVWGSEQLTDLMGTEASFSSFGVTRGGRIIVEDLYISDPVTEGETFFYSPRVEVTINPLTLLKEGVNLSRVYILRPAVYIYRMEDGDWNVKNFRKKDKGEEEEKEDEEKKGNPFRLRINEVILEDCVTRLDGILGENIVTVLDHRGALDITSKRQEITHYETNLNTTYMTQTDMVITGLLTVEDKVLSFSGFRLRNGETDISLKGGIDFNGDDTIDMQLNRSTFDLNQLPPRYKLRQHLLGNVEFDLTLNGYLKSPEIDARVYRADGEFYNYRYDNLSCLFHLGEGRIDIHELDADFLGGHVKGDVTFLLREKPRAYQVDVVVSDLDITQLPLGIQDKYRTSLCGPIVSYGSGFNSRNHSSTTLLDLGNSLFKGVTFQSIQAQVLGRGKGFHIMSSDIGLDGGLIELTGELGWKEFDLEVTTEATPISPLMKLLEFDYDVDGELFCSVELADTYKNPSVNGYVLVKDGDIYGWKFPGLESDIRISQPDGLLEGEMVMRAFMLEKGGFLAEDMQMGALFDREGIRIDSLKVMMEDSTFIEGKGDLLYENGSISFKTPDLWLKRKSLEVNVSELDSKIDWEEQGIDIDLLRLNVGGGEATVKGKLTWPENIDLLVEVSSVQLDAVGSLIPEDLNIEGELDMKLVVGNNFERPEVALDARIDRPGFKGVVADSIAVSARYSGSRLEVERLTLKGGGQDCSIDGSIPLLVNLVEPQVEGILDDSLNLRIDLEKSNLRALSLVTDEIDFGSGEIQGYIALGGTLGSPVWRGKGEVIGGEGVFTRTNTYFNNLGATFHFHEDSLIVPSLTASLMGDGSLKGFGRARMQDFLPAWIDFDIVTQNYMVNQVRYISSLAFDSNIRVTGPVEHPNVIGEMIIHRGVLDIPVNEGSQGDEEGQTPFNLQLNLQANNNLWIRNKQMNVETFVDMDLVTREGRIVPDGDVEIIRGTYTYYGTVFDIEEGEIHFFGSHPINPALDVLTTRQIRGRIIENENSVRVSNDFNLSVYGNYRDVKFDIIVYDTNGDVLAIDKQKALTLLLANMTNEEFDQQATPSRQKFIGQIESILNQQTNSLIQPISRLDILELRTNLLSGDSESTSAQLTVGQYVTRDFFVSYSQDIIDPSVNNITVEVFLGRKSSVVGQTDSKGKQYSIELKYRVTY